MTKYRVDGSKKATLLQKGDLVRIWASDYEILDMTTESGMVALAVQGLVSGDVFAYLLTDWAVLSILRKVPDRVDMDNAATVERTDMGREALRIYPTSRPEADTYIIPEDLLDALEEMGMMTGWQREDLT